MMSSTNCGVALVTGAAGFIGSAVARALAAANWKVLGLGRGVGPEYAQVHRVLTLPDPTLEAVIAECRPGLVVHCAGPASVPASISDPQSDFDGTVPVMFQLLDVLRRAAPQARLLYLSSAAVYGNPARLPVQESDPLSPISPYGFHRLHCELLIQEHRMLYGLQASSLRVFSAYGPGLRRQVVWDLLIRAASSDHLRLHGTGQETRDFIHVDDIAGAVTTLARLQQWQPTYNLASGEETAIVKLAEVIAALQPHRPRVSVDGISPPGMPARWRADVGQLAAAGFVARHRVLDDLPAIQRVVQSALQA